VQALYQAFAKPKSIQNDKSALASITRNPGEFLRQCVARGQIQIDKQQFIHPPHQWPTIRESLVRELVYNVVLPQTQKQITWLETESIETNGRVCDIYRLIDELDKYERKKGLIPKVTMKPTFHSAHTGIFMDPREKNHNTPTYPVNPTKNSTLSTNYTTVKPTSKPDSNQKQQSSRPRSKTDQRKNKDGTNANGPKEPNSGRPSNSSSKNNSYNSKPYNGKQHDADSQRNNQNKYRSSSQGRNDGREKRAFTPHPNPPKYQNVRYIPNNSQQQSNRTQQRSRSASAGWNNNNNNQRGRDQRPKNQNQDRPRSDTPTIRTHADGTTTVKTRQGIFVLNEANKIRSNSTPPNRQRRHSEN
jgi:hypothetical protein